MTATILTLRGPKTKSIIIGFAPDGEAIWGTETRTLVREGQGWREIPARNETTLGGANAVSRTR